MQIFWARLANFGHLGLISYPLIVSMFHNETHDPKGQENKSLNTFFYLSNDKKDGQKMANTYQCPLLHFLSEFFQISYMDCFHKTLVEVWIQALSDEGNQDGRRNGRHLLVCTYRHSTLVIYCLIAAKFHIYATFIKLSPKFEYGFCPITKMAAKWLWPVSLHLWTLLRCMSGLLYFKVFPEWVTMECFMIVSKSE